MTAVKQNLIEKAAAEAARIQCRDDVCSRSTLAGLASVFDFIPQELVTASGGLCGGTGSASGSCGAYCAGLLAVGLRFNASIEKELAEPNRDLFSETTASKMVEYRERFMKEFGTILCPKIHEKLFGRAYDLMNPVDQQAFFELEGHAETCSRVVAAAARIAAEMITEGEPR